VRWFAPDEVPWEEIPFESTVNALRGLLAGEPGIELFREVSSPGRAPIPRNHCVRCGTALGPPGADGATRCSGCGALRWDNPAPSAGFFAVDDRRVLLGLRRQGRDGAGSWALPSGHMEPGETPAETAQRELLEETGVRAQAERFIGLFASGDHWEAVYTGPVLDQASDASDEFESLEWFTGAEAAALPAHHGTPDLIRWARTDGLLD